MDSRQTALVNKEILLAGVGGVGCWLGWVGCSLGKLIVGLVRLVGLCGLSQN